MVDNISRTFYKKNPKNVLKVYNTSKFGEERQIWMYYVLENLSRNELKRLF